jgi:hypothetical protein
MSFGRIAFDTIKLSMIFDKMTHSRTAFDRLKLSKMIFGHSESSFGRMTVNKTTKSRMTFNRTRLSRMTSWAILF